MALHSIHHRSGNGVGTASDDIPHPFLETVERGTYTALLAMTGFIIVSLLKVAERHEHHEHHEQAPHQA